MPPGDGVHILAIAATQDCHQRNRPPTHRFDHAALSCHETLIGQGKLAQAIILMWINASDVKDQIRANLIQ
jgi:hypothetical protein